MSRAGPIQVGQTYGRRLIVALDRKEQRARSTKSFWLTRCACGTERVVCAESIRRNPGCGCVAQSKIRKHGLTNSPTWKTWRSMHARCKNPRMNGYRNYGGRGIAVCERWNSFEAFVADMGVRPEGKTIDRIDPDGNYEPGNCRWSTVSEQQKNLRVPRARDERGSFI